MYTPRSCVIRASMVGAALVLGAASFTEAATLLPHSLVIRRVVVAPPTSPSPGGVLPTPAVDPEALGGDLDLNDESSLKSLERLTDGLFSGYIASVFVRPDTFAGPATPTSGSSAPPAFPLGPDRNAPSAVVGFQYSLPGSPGTENLQTNPADPSFTVVVRGNAGLTSLGGGLATLDCFEPPVSGGSMPEPTSLMLLGSAFALAGGVARRRATTKVNALG